MQLQADWEEHAYISSDPLTSLSPTHTDGAGKTVLLSL